MISKKTVNSNISVDSMQSFSSNTTSHQHGLYVLKVLSPRKSVFIHLLSSRLSSCPMRSSAIFHLSAQMSSTRPAHSPKVHILIHKLFIGQLLCTRLSAGTEVFIVHKTKCPHLHGDSNSVRKMETESFKHEECGIKERTSALGHV